MTANDIFGKVSARMIEGMMLHDKLANYYDFLDMMGFKRMHEYYFLSDAAEMRCVNRYYINHYNELLSEAPISEPFSIPAAWYSSNRKNVGPNTKRSSTKTAMETWTEWLHETKRLYEQCYKDLCGLGEIAGACKVKELVYCADMNAKCADRLHINLNSIDYDLPTIYLMQDELHEKYDKLGREIGVSIC